MTKRSGSGQPQIFNTEGLFDEVYNSDPSKKCMARYVYVQADKSLGCTGSKVIKPPLENNACRVRFQTQQNGPYDYEDVTGGNIALQRTGVARDRIQETLGNKYNRSIQNAGIGQTEGAETFQPNNDAPEFTTMPVSIQGGMTSGMNPYQTTLMESIAPNKCKHQNVGDVRNEVTSSLENFKDGLLYSITFGQYKNKKEKFSVDNPAAKISGKIIGVIICIFVIWFLLSLFIAIGLYAKAKSNEDGMVKVCKWFTVKVKSDGDPMSGFGAALSDTMCLPFSVIANACEPAPERNYQFTQLTTGGFKKPTKMLAQEDCVL